MLVVALVPAYNEEDKIGDTIEALLSQTFPVRVVVIPNGCSDSTADIASSYPVNVMSFAKLEHKKSEAMNLGWHSFCKDADLVITVDADTMLSPTAVEEWVEEFTNKPNLAGSCARFTMHQDGKFLTRLQRMDFSMGIDISLRRGWTCVLAGAGSCFRNSVLRTISERSDREGPWTYASEVEDFEVTYRARVIGHECSVSPTVRAYTDAMSTWSALRAQRRKWLVGTITDLSNFGLNKYTKVMWAQQLLGFSSFLILMLFATLMAVAVSSGSFHYSKVGLIFSFAIPVLILLKNIKHSLRIPHRDRWDIALACSVVTYEIFSWVRIYWFLSAWGTVIRSKVSKRSHDLWAMQYAAENK